MQTVVRRVLLSVVAVLAAFVMCSFFAPQKTHAMTVDSGTFNDTVQWEYEDNGKLTFTGSGEISSEDGNYPWQDYAYEVTEIAFNGSFTTLGKKCFANCSSVSSITVPDSITSINGGAFRGCSSLTSIMIPDSVTTIGSSAFSGCSSLTSVTIPDSVQSMGSAVFNGCGNLNELSIPFVGSSRTAEKQYALFGYIFGETSYTGGVETQQHAAVSQSGNTTSFLTYYYYIPGSLETVAITDAEQLPQDAFEHCNSLTCITILDGVTSIGKSAFSGCSSLTRISIPGSVTSIGSSAFYECDNIEIVNIVDTGSWLSIDMESTKANPLEVSWKAKLCNNNAPITEAVIPNTIESIRRYAFRGCSSLTSITIPDSVTNIEERAFAGCSGLTSITIPNSVTSIGFCAFDSCSSLKSITIPNSVTSIGGSAFGACSSLQSVTFMGNMTSIEHEAFVFCSSLQSVTFMGSVTSISGYAFRGCSRLTSITFPEGVNSLGDFLFSSSVKSITIPGSVTNISNKTFKDYDGGYLKAIIYTVPDSYIATHCPDGCTIRYLCDKSRPESYLGFIVDRISVQQGNTINVSDYLKTSYSLKDCNITVSDESRFLYDDGVLACLGAGECSITVEKDGMSTSAILSGFEGNASPIQEINFPEDRIELIKGEQRVNPVSLSPANTSISGVVWSSSDETVATVENGLITAVGSGTAIITASSKENGSIHAESQVIVTNPLFGIIPVSGNPVRIEKGTTRKLQYYKYPYDAENVEVTFSSNNTDILEIDNEGKMTAKQAGTAEVTITAGEISNSCEVVVIIPVSGISLDTQIAQVETNNTKQLNVIFEPDDTTERNVTWTSNKTSVATVDKNGLVTAHGKGIAVITAKAGPYTATCTIVCPDIPLTGIEIEPSIQLEYGDTYTVSVTYQPSTTTDDTTVTWSTSDTKIFTVSQEGVITTKGVGTATLSATVGDFTAESTVTIAKKTPVISEPDPISATCNQKLSALTLPNRFVWKDSTQSVGSEGTKSFDAKYVPSDTAHYNIIDPVPVTVIVSHKFNSLWTKNSSAHWHKCACGARADQEIHSFGEWEVTKEATCTSEGQEKRVCEVCDYAETRSIEIKNHEWESEYTVDTPASCTSDGVKSIHCKDCDAVKENNAIILPATGHTYGDWQRTKEPTCTEDGQAQRTCENCEEVDVLTLARRGHDWKTEYTIDIAATCTTEGSKSIHCRDCDAILENSAVVIPATGHSYGDWVVTKAATCTTTGTKKQTCSVCGNYKTVTIPKLGHNYASHVVEPTCTQAGYTLHYCLNCNDQYTDTETEALGHSFGEWQTVNTATCTAEGSQQRVCATCGATETRGVAKADHQWKTSYTIDKAATCTTDGSKSIHCKNCEAIKNSTVIPAVGHTYTDWEQTRESTCTTQGRAVRQCAVCGAIERMNFPALGHDYNHQTEPAKVGVDGREYDECSRCGDIINEVILPALHPSIADVEIIVASGNYVYQNKEHKPAVTITYGGVKLRKDDDYLVQYDNNVNAGTATIKISGTGDYRGSTTRTFTVKPQPLEGASATLVKLPAKTYTGKAIKPSINGVKSAVTADGLVKGTDYTVSYKNNKNVGIATVVITGKGNYTGSIAKTFTINPKGAALVKPKVSKKQMTVKWKKQAAKMSKSRINGYEIQYSTSSAFKGKTKKIVMKGYGKTSRVIKKLKPKKKYYVRIRTYMTVGGKKYCSPWSKKKAVKVK